MCPKTRHELALGIAVLGQFFFSSSFAMIHAWGSTYMPLQISMYTLPSAFTFYFMLQSFMILDGMLLKFSLIYSYIFMGVLR